MWDPPWVGLTPRNNKAMSKRMTALNALVDKTKTYSIDEAVALVKKTGIVKFDASVEVHAKLGIDPSKGEQQIRSTVVLPHGTGKSKKIAAFVTAEREKEAKEAGADFVYGEEDIKKIKDTEKIEFDIAVTTPDMMPKLATIAKVLGPKGLMPNPKTETVGPQLKKMIEELKKGKVTFKNDDTSNIHQSIGKVSFSEAQLKENLSAFIDALKKAKPASAKGTYLQSLILSTSMGPSIKISSEG
jgi:large subunit ribosomal protein L1